MKGKISLGDFIKDVKQELIEAQDTSGDPFYELEEVRLEVISYLIHQRRLEGNCLLWSLEARPRLSKPIRCH